MLFSQSTRRGVAVLVVTALLTAVSPAWAMDVVKSAGAMAQQALKAYESGDHARAAQLYVLAWKTNPAESAYLFAAARSEQAAGDVDAADAHYRAYLALPGIPATLHAKAQTYLGEVTDSRAEQKAQAAARASRSDDQTLAAQLFKSAYDLAPRHWEWLFKAGASAQTAGDAALAEVLLRDYLRGAPPDAPDRKEAELRLSRVQGKGAVAKEKLPDPPRKSVAEPAPLQATQKAATPLKPLDAKEKSAVATATVGPATSIGSGVSAVLLPPSGMERAMPWVVGGLGVAAGALAAVLYGTAAADRQQLDTDLAKKGADGLIVGVTKAQAQADLSSIEHRKTGAAIAGGVAVVGVGAALWLWWRLPKVSIGPGPGTAGVQVSLGF